VEVLKVGEMGSAVRVFDPERRELKISEVLRRGSKNFQLAYQIGLLDCGGVIERITREPELTSDESRALCAWRLANYFSGAALMPTVISCARRRRSATTWISSSTASA